MGGQNNLKFDNATCPNLQPDYTSTRRPYCSIHWLVRCKRMAIFLFLLCRLMLGMNNYFYSFKGGNLYRHNTNDRNNYYNVQYNSQQHVFHDQPLENKLFKTINLESDSAWTITLDSDIQTGASIDYSWFEKKEGAWFAFVRNNGTLPAAAKEYPMRSANGIGRSTSVSIVGSSTIINFATNPLVEIGSDIAVGDIVYYSPPPYNRRWRQGNCYKYRFANATSNIVIDNQYLEQ